MKVLGQDMSRIALDLRKLVLDHVEAMNAEMRVYFASRAHAGAAAHDPVEIAEALGEIRKGMREVSRLGRRRELTLEEFARLFNLASSTGHAAIQLGGALRDARTNAAKEMH